MHSLAWCFPVRHSPQIWSPSALPSAGLMGSGRQLWMCYSKESDCMLVTTGPKKLPLFNTTSLPCSQIPFSRESKACFTIIHSFTWRHLMVKCTKLYNVTDRMFKQQQKRRIVLCLWWKKLQLPGDVRKKAPSGHRSSVVPAVIN